ncbi:MAG: hypothetical protein B6244_13865 [Candidatus Cloacimonetes bacterium 4572_55]|nr:MAG: hypothetical protein B6244_13865 [Candidatus Cloacimonetes bacterium 4572_55]
MDAKKMEQGLALFLEGLEIEDSVFDKELAVKCMLEEWRDEFLSGYLQDPKELLSSDVIADARQMVLMKDISFVSFCAHHLTPISGVVHLAYLPNRKVIGLSRLVKLVRCFSRRLQLQERLTNQLASSLMTHMQAKGSACLIRADQFCVSARGVRERTETITTSFKGSFFTDGSLRRDFLELCRDA